MLEAFIRPAYQRWLVDPVANRIAKQLSPKKINASCLYDWGVGFPCTLFS